MEREYLEIYDDLMQRHWWWRSRGWMLERFLRRHLDSAPRILDIGCGDGSFMDRLDDLGQPLGLEPSRGEEARSPGGHRVLPCYLSDLDEPPGWDLTLLLDVIEHVDDDVGLLREVRDVLRPGGLLLVTVPAHQVLWTRHDDLNHHLRRYSKAMLRARLEAAGFELVESRYFFHWLAGLKLLVRALEAVKPPRSALPGIPHRPLNELLVALGRLDWAIGGALRFPIGSSVLALAVKLKPVAT